MIVFIYYLIAILMIFINYWYNNVDVLSSYL